MSDFSAALGNLGGANHTYTAKDGTVYPYVLIDHELEVAFERAYYAQAKEALRGDRDMLGDEEFRAELAKLRQEFTDGEFSFIGPRVMGVKKARPDGSIEVVKPGFFNTPKGQLLLVSLIFGGGGGKQADLFKLAALIQDDTDGILDVIESVMEESFPSQKEILAATRARRRAEAKKRMAEQQGLMK